MKQRPSLLEILGLHFWDEAVCAASEAQLQDVCPSRMSVLAHPNSCPWGGPCGLCCPILHTVAAHWLCPAQCTVSFQAGFDT